MRLSKALDAEINAASKINAAAEAAWGYLTSDATRIVQLERRLLDAVSDWQQAG